MNNIVKRNEFGIITGLNTGIPGKILRDGNVDFSTENLMERYVDVMTNNRAHISIDAWIKVLAKSPENEWTVALATDSLINANILRRIYAVVNDKVKRKKKLGFEPVAKFQDDNPGIFITQREVGKYTTSANGWAYAIPHTGVALQFLEATVLPLMEVEALKILEKGAK